MLALLAWTPETHRRIEGAHHDQSHSDHDEWHWQCHRFRGRAQCGYYAEVQPESLDEQSRLIEQVMQFAFDILGVQHLDICVFGVRQKSCCADVQPA
jgi:hypothetical protein